MDNEPQTLTPMRKRIQRKKAVKSPIIASVIRRKRAQATRSVDITSDEEEREEKQIKISSKSKKLSKKRAQHQPQKAKNDITASCSNNDKKKSPMYIQLDEKDNNQWKFYFTRTSFRLQN